MPNYLFTKAKTEEPKKHGDKMQKMLDSGRLNFIVKDVENDDLLGEFQSFWPSPHFLKPAKETGQNLGSSFLTLAMETSEFPVCGF